MHMKGSWEKAKAVVASWRLGDYFRQLSIVVAGIVITFWGSDLITENAQRKEVRATMQLVAEELEYNLQELRNIRQLLAIDVHMSTLLREQGMDIEGLPTDTLQKYHKFFDHLNELTYRADALDVLKSSSLMQYISDKRMLQDVLQVYFELGRQQASVSDYYALKSNALHHVVASPGMKDFLVEGTPYRDYIAAMLRYDTFVSFVAIVPSYLDWQQLDRLEDMLDKQIRVLTYNYR